MKRKYVTLRYSEQLECSVIDIANAMTVFEKSDEPRPTGLLDADGNELFYIEQIDQIGFIRFEGEE